MSDPVQERLNRELAGVKSPQELEDWMQYYDVEEHEKQTVRNEWNQRQSQDRGLGTALLVGVGAIAGYYAVNGIMKKHNNKHKPGWTPGAGGYKGIDTNQGFGGPQQFGAPQQYGQPNTFQPPTGGFQQPQYGGFQQPPPQGYGQPPQAYGQQPYGQFGQPGFGGPAPGPYGAPGFAPPPQAGFGAPYGAPAYGAPPQVYGQPQGFPQQNYGSAFQPMGQGAPW